MTGIDRVVVVVPAHNEEATLPACLAALGRARAELPEHVSTGVIVVLDECTDSSAEHADRAGIPTLRVSGRNVGHARHAGAIALLGSDTAATTWLATTDADSRVPAQWLCAQLHAAQNGWDVHAGTVLVDCWEEHPAHVRTRYEAAYAAPVRGGHVHGANLGIRASAYHRAGGFPPAVTAEDHLVVAMLVATGATVHYTDEFPVVTSARLRGRAPDGLAAHLTSFH